MTMHVKESGTWRQVAATGFYARVSGTWRQIQSGWVNVSGTWRQFFQAITYALTGATITATGSGGTVTARLRVMANGTVQKEEQGVTTQLNPSTDWVIPNGAASSSYEVRCTVTSGSLTGTTGTWLDMSTNREWFLSRSTVGTSGATADVEIRLSGVTLASASFTFSATRVF